MAELIGFILVFAALALLIGTLAQGVLRIVGFAVLVVITFLSLGPVVQRSSVANFFSPNTQPDTTVVPGGSSNPLPNNSSPAPTSQSPSFGTTNSPSTGSPTVNRPTTNQTATRSSGRGVRGGW